MPVLSDSPTNADTLDRSGFVRELGDLVSICKPPHVFCVSGTWGSGKTSILKQLAYYLTEEHWHFGEDPETVRRADVIWGRDWKKKKNVTVVSFEAWRCHGDTSPVTGLLHDIRGRLSLTNTAIKEAKKLGTVAVESLLSFGSLIKMVGVELPDAGGIRKVGEAYEAANMEAPLPSRAIRALLEKAITTLIGKNGRLVILIDDLDRCEPMAAYRLLEGIKIYLSIPSCVFVIAMDRDAAEFAVAKVLGDGLANRPENDKRLAQTLSHDYLEKICNTVKSIPPMTPGAMKGWLVGCEIEEAKADALTGLVIKFDCLPWNPRKAKSFAVTVASFLPRAMGIEAWEDQKRFKAALIFSCLYNFNPDLYVRVSHDPMFYNEILKRVQGQPVSERSPLHTLELPYDFIKDPSGPTAEPIQGLHAHADPTRGGVFLAAKLMEDTGSLEKDHIMAMTNNG